MPTAKHELKTIPTKDDIDALAQLYVDAETNVRQAKEQLSVFHDHLVELIEKHGFVPKKATKSRRIEGHVYKITRSASQSVDVDGTAVMRLRDALHGWKFSRWFRKLFKRETVFVLQDGAQELVAQLLAKGAPSDLQILFSNAVLIKGNSPSLKVENKDEKEAKSK
jgi:hypothetical protein